MSRLGQAMGTQRARKRRDFYPTIDRRAVPALLAAMLAVGDIAPGQAVRYAEPCAGQGDLIQLLQHEAPQLHCAFGLEYDWQDEGLHNRWPIAHGNALTLGAPDLAGVELIVTNPPWKREALHPLITHLASLRPTWLLYDGSWAFTKQAAPFHRVLTDVAAVGRLRFFPPPGRPLRLPGESDAAYRDRARKWRSMDPPDDCAWYRFCAAEASAAPPRLHLAVPSAREASAQGQLALA
ncbi:MAG: hypothetical protein ABJF09_00585 [Qipengyuania citrea]|uniref:hypothetical protein n=1 Tax=Qipengyuania citrea TaxID=225971 RepID=UPI0032667F3C